MFGLRRLRSSQDHARQPASEFSFTWHSDGVDIVERKAGRRQWVQPAPGSYLAAVDEAPWSLKRCDDLRLSIDDVPSLTITSDPFSFISVIGATRDDWHFRLVALGDGDCEASAYERAAQVSMTRAGGTVAISTKGQAVRHARREGRGYLVVDAPSTAPVVVHASYSAVQVRDVAAPVRVTAPHARILLLDTTGPVDAVGATVHFLGKKGDVTLDGDQVMLKLTAARFDGAIRADAQQSIKLRVPEGFQTPFRAVVNRRDDFVCRAGFRSDVVEQKVGPLHYFTYAGDGSIAPQQAMHLHSQHSTIVIDEQQPAAT